MQKIVRVIHKGYPDAETVNKMQYWYWCLGCNHVHAFATHTFNADYLNPTVSPSLLHSNPEQYHTCHSFIRNGFIEYLGDCWHDLKGKTVELPDVVETIKKRNYGHSGEFKKNDQGIWELIIDWS